MVKLESGHMGVSSSQEINHDESHFRSEQSTLRQPHDNGTEYTHSVSSEQKNELGSSVVPNESGGTCTKVSDAVIDEKLLPLSENAVNISIPELSEHLIEDLSERNLTNNDVCGQQTISEKTEAYNSECIQDKASENNVERSSHAVQNKPGEGSNVLGSGHVADESLWPLSVDVSEEAASPHLKPSPENASNSGSVIENKLPGLEDRDKKVCSEDLYQNFKDARSIIQRNEFEPNLCGEYVHPEPVESDSPISRCMTTEPSGQLAKSSPVVCVNSSLEAAADNRAIESSLIPPEEVTKDSNLGVSETPTKYSVKHSARPAGGKNSKTRKKNSILRSSDRVLRSRSQEKPKVADVSTSVAEPSSKVADLSTSVAEPSSKVADVSTSVAEPSSNGESKRKKKNMSKRNVADDEYSKIRRHLRYLLNRINYEQSLITAYSTEGWKGLSLEKLKPEKELQRAKSEILRRKLKIRDLFQRLDSLCAEGRLPESLFDSEGEIDSEDIFCSKCGTKDLPLDNDIILCDGACDRGFHQYCLDPPLLKEDIPPDDEGWLCPGCDCKVDCIELLNDSQGTNISISDGWERVFPEVAATGHTQDPNFGLPSDDSDDNDYNPDGPEPEEKNSGDESSSDGSSSDGSDFTSASEEFEIPQNDQQCMGLPSDDSEDDNYDPEAPDDEMVNQESSSSDFTSDSEDLAATVKDKSSQQDEDLTSAVSPIDSKAKNSKISRKKGSMNNELSSLLESTPGQNGFLPVSKKRGIERLDYKKLYDAEYGNVSSNSSDDEDWSDASGPGKRKKSGGKAASRRSGKISGGIKQQSEGTEHTPKSHQKSNSKNKSGSPAKLQGHPSGPGSSSKGASPSANRKLGEDERRKLYESFKKNQYPDRAAKEGLAAELGLSAKQVAKWFDNTRWSFNHPSSADKADTKSKSPGSRKRRKQ